MLCRGCAGQMLKRERPHLLFVEKCSIFALAKEETVRSRRLPPFLSPACAQNYPALAQNYKALGFIYVLFAEKYKALAKNARACSRKNPAQKGPLGKFMLNLLVHFDALSLMLPASRRHWWRRVARRGVDKAQAGRAQGREVFVYSGVARQKWRIAQKDLAIMRGSWDIARGRLGQPQRKSGNRAKGNRGP